MLNSFNMSKQSQALYVLAIRHDEMARVLEEWFVLVEGMESKERSEIWSRSAIGIVVRGRLRDLGYWKNLPRGNPAKGFKVSREQ